jgi:predicted amidohydrolase
MLNINYFLKFLTLNPLIYSICIFMLITGCFSRQHKKENDTNWEFYSQRADIAPVHWVDGDIVFKNQPTLALAGEGKAYINGSWTRLFDVNPGRFYEFKTHFKTDIRSQIDRSVLAQITWLNKAGERVDYIEYPAFGAIWNNDWSQIRQIYKVPESTVMARIDLILRWAPEGTVFFGGTELREVTPPGSRMVRIAAIHHRPGNMENSSQSRKSFEPHIISAGEKGADIVCLPEGITIVGTSLNYVEVSEPIPGPSTEYLGGLAKEYNMYIVAGIYEKEGPVVYNTSVLIGRDGILKGKYRKTALPREEIDGGITPGNEYPVFDTDFGRIGMMICWDVFFPEVARQISLNGAEIIFMPIWGGDLTLSKARAIENQIYLVSSTYDMKTGIFDKTGNLIAEGTEDNPLAIADIDLNEREMWWWLGEFRNRIKRERPEVNK